MILVDASVWIDHLRRAEPELQTLLNSGRVVTHPFVIGELACGYLRRRDAFIAELQALPQTPAATHDEAMQLVRRQALAGLGIGWADVHLLASTLLAPPARLWTRDKRLAAAAAALRVLHPPPVH